MIPSTSFQVPRSSITARSGSASTNLENFISKLNEFGNARQKWLEEDLRSLKLPLYQEKERLKQECIELRGLLGELPDNLKFNYHRWTGLE
jgi:hypothetical protein